MPVSDVAAANRHWEIVAVCTMTPRPPITHDGCEWKLQPERDIHVYIEQAP